MSRKGNLLVRVVKVVSWEMNSTTNDSQIVFVVPKMSHEECDVVVDLASPLPDAEEEGGFEVKAPEIESVNPKPGSVGQEITISGNYFGTKKPKSIWVILMRRPGST